MAPGILYVTMHTEAALSPAAFHDWYNNEHGPNRLRLPFIPNGFRYRASDLSSEPASVTHPEWMAVYDVTDMSEMPKPAYQRLRGPEVETERERGVRKNVKINRKLFDLIEGSERKSKSFEILEEPGNEGKGNVMVAVWVVPKKGRTADLHEFYEKEHVELLSKIPGWRRTRRYETSTEQPVEGEKEHLTLVEFAPENGLDGPESRAAQSTPWMQKLLAEVVEKREIRVYGLYYTLGTPRDISNFSKDYTLSWRSVDGLTKTGPTFVESYITTKDGAILPYRLEGSQDPAAPLILLSNSILVNYNIWDVFVAQFLSANPQYRVLRYQTRGRSAQFGKQSITLDTLSSDVIALLDWLRVPKAALLMGVSLGGATVLNTALKYPDRVEAFISCDTNSSAPPSNRKAWGERIALAESEALVASDGTAIVGNQLAQATVDRWFVGPAPENVRKMVEDNSLEGFKASVEALYAYDVKEEMKQARVPGAFLVGSGDGVLPDMMKGMAEAYNGGKGVFAAVDGAGHLPMVEKPEGFVEAVQRFLKKNE